MDRIDEAINIAARSNDMSHIVRVASRLDGDAAIVGWLHDSVEDGYASEAELRELFSDEIVDAVMVVSRRDGEKYVDFIERIATSGNDMAIAVKLADLGVNLARARVDRFSLVDRYTKAINRLTRGWTVEQLKGD
jgi:(p)ppGpp synthase/HD superfamily hydrolase